MGRNGSHNCKPGHYGLSMSRHWMEHKSRGELNFWKTLKSLLDLRRQLLYSKEVFKLLNDGYYCMTVKRIKFKLIRIKAWTLGSCLIERLNSLQACRTSRSCGRVHQVEVVDLVGVFYDNIVDLVGVDDEQSGSSESGM